MTYNIDMALPVNYVADRKLNYSFMAAEALWILRGDEQVEPLAKHVARMREFSDDGVILHGAYGPRITEQWAYVGRTLLEDETSRQAVLTTWIPNPPKSKDIPCTIAQVFQIRERRLNMHVFMRSSDVWLGVPYDVFSFCMVAAKLACLINQTKETAGQAVELGTLSLTAVSSHLYATNIDEAISILESKPGIDTPLSTTLDQMAERAQVLQIAVINGNWDGINKSLEECEAKTENEETLWRIRP